MEENFVEHRQYERFKIRLEAKLINLKDKKESSGYTVDLSANGIGLVSNQNFPPDTSLEVRLNNPHNQKSIYMRGRLIWSKPLDESNYRLGIELEDVDLVGLAQVLELI
ncbi:MAG: PilZ domain-containing protein [Candidatus Omnitrophica bacterium]|nr:PilZ domain-containing protein [Candidatus Omnitrophota bacterium]